jgi:hypothetical protein
LSPRCHLICDNLTQGRRGRTGEISFGTPAQIWSRDEHDKRDLTTEFMFFALLRKGINEELPGWPEVVVVFDGQDGSAQRKATDSDYKANRPDGATRRLSRSAPCPPSRSALTCSPSPGSRSPTPRPTT